MNMWQASICLHLMPTCPICQTIRPNTLVCLGQDLLNHITTSKLYGGPPTKLEAYHHELCTVLYRDKGYFITYLNEFSISGKFISFLAVVIEGHSPLFEKCDFPN